MAWVTDKNGPRVGFARGYRLRYPGGSPWVRILANMSQWRW
jgi:hypothetical protein